MKGYGENSTCQKTIANYYKTKGYTEWHRVKTQSIAVLQNVNATGMCLNIK